jgi:hypothetical protein
MVITISGPEKSVVLRQSKGQLTRPVLVDLHSVSEESCLQLCRTSGPFVQHNFRCSGAFPS